MIIQDDEEKTMIVVYMGREDRGDKYLTKKITSLTKDDIVFES